MVAALLAKDALIVPIAAVASCVAAAGCTVGILYGCDRWCELGYSSYIDCAIKSYGKLPPHSQIGCGVSAIGCMACIIKSACSLASNQYLNTKSSGNRAPCTCPPDVERELKREMHHLCDDFKQSCNPLTTCEEIELYIARASACIAARLGIMFTCAGGGDPAHWEELRRRSVGLANCAILGRKKRCGNNRVVKVR